MKPVARGRRIGTRRRVTSLNSVDTGNLLEFKYGTKQKPGQVGGWKNDPTPLILMLYDDTVRYMEGINTNYLSDSYLKILLRGVDAFPGLKSGRRLYSVIKKTAPRAVAVAYRKYIRSSVQNIWLHDREK